MCHLTLFVPAVIKHSFKFLSPLRWGMVRRMHSRRAKVVEPWFIGICGANISSPSDRFIRHVSRKVVTLLWRLGLRNPGGIPINRRVVLMRFPLIETIEVIKPKTRGPTIKRPRRTDIGLRRVMPFAKHACRIAIVPQHLRDERGALWDNACVAWVTRPHLDDYPSANRVMVSPRQQRPSRGTA